MGNGKIRKIWLVAALVALVLALAVPAVAAEIQEELPTHRSVPAVSRRYFTDTRTSEENLSRYVDVDEFIEDILAQAASCPGKVNISKYNIPNSETLMNEIRELIWYRTPLAFHMYSLGFDYNSSYITYITVDYYTYSDTPAEYQACYSTFIANANKLLAGVEGNNTLTDVQKALLLHDRLIQWVAYDWENYNNCGGDLSLLPDTDFTAYGVFGERVAVCQGYSMAYMYLLDQVGIDNDYVDSDTLCHAWNIVYINGRPYHVDATWDDPDMLGMVEHDNFLLSSSGLWNTGHEAYDYNTAPNDTTYEGYLWEACDTEFQLIGDRLYYLDYEKQEILYWSAGSTGKTTTLLRSAEDGWTNGYGNYSVLATKDGNLLYSAPDRIYVVTSGGGRSTVYAPVLYSGEYIYGFTYEDNVLHILISSSPDIDYISTERYVTVELGDAKYTITFQNWDGTILSEDLYSAGATVQLPTDPTRPDGVNYTYRFSGWTPEVTVVTGDAVYTATYERILKKSYTITFVNWDGTVLSEKKYKEGSTLQLPPDPVRPDSGGYTYLFAGWTPSVNTTVTADAVYTATYTQIANTDYTITFKNWDDTVISTKTYRAGEAVQLPPDPTRPDGVNYTYRFSGWTPEVTVVTGDAVYTATYERILKKSYTITFVNWDGTVLSEKKYKEGSTVQLPPDPVRPDDGAYTYTFDGWTPEVTVVTEAATYRATYTQTPVILQAGWVQENGTWYYYENGTKLTDQWLYQYGTWYWLDSNGAMASNQWLYQYGTWYWFNEGGAMASNQWLYQYGTWYWFQESGAMAENQWILYGNDWYWLEAGGQMAVSCWKQDSVGWVYLGASGAMLRNSWCMDGQGWCYVGADGYAVTNCWKQDSVGWIYLNSNGSMTKSQWLYDGGFWYYLDANGYMLSNTSLTQYGVTYYFNASGICTNA